MREAFIWNRHFHFHFFAFEFVWLTFTWNCVCAICVAMSKRRIEAKLNRPRAPATTYLFSLTLHLWVAIRIITIIHFTATHTRARRTRKRIRVYSVDCFLFAWAAHKTENIVFLLAKWAVRVRLFMRLHVFLHVVRRLFVLFDGKCLAQILSTETALRASHHFAAQVCMCVCSNVCQTCFGMSAENVLFGLCSRQRHIRKWIKLFMQ